jgi:hypothetical protein
MRATYAINGQSLDALCADSAVLSQLNRGTDQLRLSLAKDPGWSYGQAITVTRNGSTYWTGHVTIPARNFQRNERWEIVIKNGWHDEWWRWYERRRPRISVTQQPAKQIRQGTTRAEVLAEQNNTHHVMYVSAEGSVYVE